MEDSVNLKWRGRIKRLGMSLDEFCKEAGVSWRVIDSKNPQTKNVEKVNNLLDKLEEIAQENFNASRSELP